MAKPTVCRMCGENFKPVGAEHICQPCIKEIDALEFATPPTPQRTENNETNEQLQTGTS